MRTVTHHASHCLALIVAIVTLAGCGGSHPVVVNDTVLRLRLDEFRITPQFVQVHPGRLKIIAFNTGQLTHNLKVELAHRDATGQAIVLGGTPTALPGGQVEAKMMLPPGRYMMVDSLANHVDLGQFGTLIVK
jgi:hypothetical protein